MEYKSESFLGGERIMWVRHGDGALIIDGKRVDIPNFSIMGHLGTGANGAVFEAHDKLLNRKVAIKVWNARGRKRARHEMAKIAGINHPLVVTTYSYGMLEEHPYAIMELVRGLSGKEWVKSKPSLLERVVIWQLYARALKYLHSTGILHGDAHLGNLLVFADNADAYATQHWGSRPKIAMKLADTGTSEFWVDEAKFAIREAHLIYETAERLFWEEGFDSICVKLSGLGYENTLAICNSVVSYLDIYTSPVDQDNYSNVAWKIASIVTETPFFDLDAVQEQAHSKGITSKHRIARRINAKLLGISNPMDVGDEITHVTREVYCRRREEWKAVRMT